jgi:formylglycine-generating enzyme required for sulfatase activity
MRIINFLILFCAALGSLGLHAQVGKYRNWTLPSKTESQYLAVIVCNQAYDHNTDLLHPIKSGEALSAALKDRGFEVMECRNLDRSNFVKVLEEVKTKVPKYKFVLFAYLGHGFEVGGENYLIPVDANPGSIDAIPQYSVGLNFVLGCLEPRAVPKLVILDACRDNPFETHIPGIGRGGQLSYGDVGNPLNTEIWYTAGKGRTVRDDNPYISEFVQSIKDYSCVNDWTRKTADKVSELTNSAQYPVPYGRLEKVENLCFGGGNVPPPAPEVDSDGDGVPDSRDKCPYEAGDKANEGCRPSLGSVYIETVKGVSFKMIEVQGGTFTMGCTGEQAGDCEDDERPSHQVTLSSYRIGETEVTQSLWRAVMGSNPSYFSDCDDCPVEQVSWDDAQLFIQKLNSLTGKRYRLPTEAEWEFAARGGNKSRGYKYSGSNNINAVAWFSSNSGSRTHSVKGADPNELGIYDMSGNVWEWCQDLRGPYGSGSQTDPTGAGSGSNRVSRGGGWLNTPRYCRVSYRCYFTPDDRYDILGFRLASQ